MCSWCWGFAPVMEHIAAMAAERAELSIVTGGLRAGEDRPMDARSKAYVQHHWEEVQRATGQPFDFSFFEREGFVYDTEPACRAVVIVRTAAKAAALPYFSALHRAFYVDCRDTTDARVLADVASRFGLPEKLFLEAFDDDNIRQATRADFHYGRQLGVKGFPTVLCRKDGEWAYLTAGYQPFDTLGPVLEGWLEN